MTDGQAAALSLETCVSLAGLFEATAPKPGNVYRGADFEDLTYVDLLVSASLVAPILASANRRPLGKTVLAAVETTRAAVGTNSNLGIVLLIAPLAKVPRSEPIDRGVARVLAELNGEDADDVYRAIRLAQPGGLGTADEGDVADEPTCGLVESMQAAANRDLVARQYAGGFGEVLGKVVPWLSEGVSWGYCLSDTIVNVQMRLMRDFPDSLIMRKCGPEVARQAADRAARVLSSGRPGDESYQQELADFDFWLRADGHRRNPGTTADLIAAGLFVMLRNGSLRPPFGFAER